MSTHQERKRWLDPADRSMEALFGLIMVLTFTGSLSVWTAGQQDVREMLIGAVGCNLAWGIIDACFYLMGILAERGRHLKLARRLRTTTHDDAIAGMMKEVMPEGVVDVMSPAERASMRERITALPDDGRRTWLTWEDLLAALGVFLWVFLVTFPVALPFVFMTDAVLALRISNGIAIALLGLIGYRLAVYAGFRRWRTILFMVLFGMAMVGLTIALGG
jgi:hypothetical protein